MYELPIGPGKRYFGHTNVIARKALEGWQGRAGLGSSPRKLLDELKRIQTVDVVMSVVNGPKLRLRCVMERRRPRVRPQ